MMRYADYEDEAQAILDQITEFAYLAYEAEDYGYYDQVEIYEEVIDDLEHDLVLLDVSAHPGDIVDDATRQKQIEEAFDKGGRKFWGVD